MSVGKRMQRYLVACLSVIITAALALVPFANTAFAADDSVPINEQTFPDPVLRKVVSYQDLNKNNVLESDELQKISNLDIVCWNDELFSIRGLELLPSLTDLSIKRCKVADFSMGSIPKVVNLSLADNGLADIDLRGRSMRKFASNGNPIRSIDLSDSNEVAHLTITGSSIAALDLSNKKQLMDINLSGNKLSWLQLPSDAAECTEVNVSNNNLSSIDVTALSRLGWFDASGNNLTQVELAHNPLLSRLNLSDNQISAIDLSQNQNLEYLNLSNNNLTELDLYNNNGLFVHRLSLDGNRLLAMIFPSSGLTANAMLNRAFEGTYYNNAFNVSAVAPIFNPSFVSNLQGATLSGAHLILPDTGEEHTITYEYRIPGAFDEGIPPILHAKLILRKGVEHLVSFDSCGGTPIATETTTNGKVDSPMNPTRTGYTFAGWYTAKDGGSKYDFAKPVTADMTLYARWTINKYEVKFDTDGGSAVKSATVEHGKTVAEPADPTRANYTFTGWYTAKSGGEKYDFAKPVTGNVTVFAQWQPRIVFSDVTDKTPHFEDIIWLADNGVSTGWLMADGRYEFRGMDTVKRQDMAAFLYRLADKAGRASGVRPKTDFTDVTSRTPHYLEVEWLGGSGISQGYRNANGTWRFEGMTSVYRQDMAAFLHRLNERLTK